jgi:hypothetical protein
MRVFWRGVRETALGAALAGLLGGAIGGLIGAADGLKIDPSDSSQAERIVGVLAVYRLRADGAGGMALSFGIVR